jgi:hypothetical protein
VVAEILVEAAFEKLRQIDIGDGIESAPGLQIIDRVE